MTQPKGFPHFTVIPTLINTFKILIITTTFDFTNTQELMKEPFQVFYFTVLSEIPRNYSSAGKTSDRGML